VRPPADHQQRLLLDRLRRAGGAPLRLADLRVGGVAYPAATIAELELDGYTIDRVHERGRLVGVKLLEPDQPQPPATGRRRRWRRPS
jgi:hypothetical protein